MLEACVWRKPTHEKCMVFCKCLIVRFLQNSVQFSGVSEAVRNADLFIML